MNGRLRFLLLALGLSFRLPVAASAADWRTFEEARLLEKKNYDGDSFYLQVKRTPKVFRLYYVDAPETDDQFPDRVEEQMAYWGIDRPAAQRLAAEAARFTREFLRDGVTVHTRMEDARGRSRLPRYYALIEKDGKDLGEELVRHGLARIYGMPVDRLPDGTRGRAMERRLKAAEREARVNLRGAWLAVERLRIERQRRPGRFTLDKP